MLLVEANDTQRANIERQLATWGCNVVTAGSYAEAEQRIMRGELFDVVILDTHLERNSLGLGRLLARESPRTSLIFATALGTRFTRPADLDVAAYISKPVKSSAMFDALIEVVAGGAAASRRTEPSVANKPTPTRSLRILLAEDNQVNQKVALGLLNKFGYSADVAGNGIEALEMLDQRPYDVVLMDVHMPEMDGCEATKRIRQDLSSEQQPTIIAMTANALSGDRERFLAIGMDDYVSKPVQPRRLAEALERAAEARGVDEGPPGDEPADVDSDTPPMLASADSPAVDASVLTELGAQIGDDDGSIRIELIDTFIQDVTERIERLESADDAIVKVEAHTIKSASAQVGALSLSAACARIEAAAASGDLSAVDTDLRALRNLADEAFGGLAAIRDTWSLV